MLSVQASEHLKTVEVALAGRPPRLECSPTCLNVAETKRGKGQGAVGQGPGDPVVGSGLQSKGAVGVVDRRFQLAFCA